MPSFTVTPDVRDKSVDTVQYAQQVDVEYPMPCVERDVINTAAVSDTGIVTNDMNISKCLVACFGRTPHAVRVTNVTQNTIHMPKTAQFHYSSVQSISLNICKHNLHADL